MKNYDIQIARIKKKLAIMRVRDSELNVFGAVSHQYKMRPVLTEQELAVIESKTPYPLPAAFRAFISKIGNGGAGPDYGIIGLYLPVYSNDAGLIMRRQEYLPVLFTPDSTNEDWEAQCAALTASISEDRGLTDAFDLEIRMMGGLMEIGEVGCGVSNYLVMHGEHQGRIVYNPHYLGKPVFDEQDNFLDWYEEWLDYILKGHRHNPVWIKDTYFSGRNCTDVEIVKYYNEASSIEARLVILSALFPGAGLSPATIAFLQKEYLHPDERIKWKALALLTTHAYEIARPLLKQLWKEHPEEVLSYVYALADQYADDWKEEIGVYLQGESGNQLLKEEMMALQSFTY